MNTKKHLRRRGIIGTLMCTSFLLFLVIIANQETRIPWQAQLINCDGMPYGYPGCPTKEEVIENQTYPENCGDGYIDVADGEECDNGRFNGLSECTDICKLLFCGDGIVSPFLNEECEPDVQEVYVIDDQTGQLTTEIRFIVASCGRVCSPPSCDENGVCIGGCNVTFKDECTGDDPAPVNIPVTEVEQESTINEDELHPAAPGFATCGDGVVGGSEECDDGNRYNFDACTNECKQPQCGDGIREGSEECDDGNRYDFDNCPNDCFIAVCGDGVRESSEDCDD
ncbi:DUF4215 domain-containing protein, partial [Candidatus Peregrinibacteria bacterium]|nr:DUF4215 domain-containing protein [Candidatus Peregrinibacteria bacterium]